jgi:Ca2+-binding RTX toxin-like protein
MIMHRASHGWLSLILGMFLLVIRMPVAVASSPKCFGLPATKVGTSGKDVIKGTSGTDVIMAKGGNDIVYAGGGFDYVCGGRGSDSLYGDRTSATAYAQYSGNDAISGGRGNDLVSADGNGDDAGDLMVGNAGDDYIDGGPKERNNGYAEEQVVVYNDAPGPITVSIPQGYSPYDYPVQEVITVTGDGTDTLVRLGIIGGSPYDDSFTNDGWIYTLSGAGGNDRINFSSSGQATGSVQGDVNFCRLVTFPEYCPTPPGPDGNDTLSFASGSYVFINVTGEGGNDTFTGDIQVEDDGVFGGTGRDVFSGTMAPAYGEEGADLFNGGPSDDAFYGGPGPDTLNGHAGQDTLDAVDQVDGNDHVNGGSGTDSCTADPGDFVLNCP